ncbi:MAG TPA: hypothetical protein VFY12_01860 [Arenimonas sp.]|nr:hypothetical protein [Arenimonas sp.]
MGTLVEAVEKAFVKLRRKRVSWRIFQKHGGVVQRGPFVGLALDGHSNVSKGPLAAKLFGLYEWAVIERIRALGPFQDVLNLGAADGYFSLGLLKANLASRSICYEMTKQGREAIQRNAERNGVADSVVIKGVADEGIINDLPAIGFDPANALVLCDIEGGEFDVLTERLLEFLAPATLIVELHDRIHSGEPNRRAEILGRLPPDVDYEVIRSVPPPWSGIEDIEALSDNDRALVTSEGRRAIGEWLIVTPKAKS